MSAQKYILYLLTSDGSQPAGTVVNIVMWDGVSDWTPPENQGIAADPGSLHPVGSVYTG